MDPYEKYELPANGAGATLDTDDIILRSFWRRCPLVALSI
jgi:hypothetical protein